jgi:hypothetical protein
MEGNSAQPGHRGKGGNPQSQLANQDRNKSKRRKEE